MLTAASYHTAWAIYLAAALALLVLVRQWLRPRVGAGWLVTLLLMLAALLLTPSLADPDLHSYAPALVVAAFDLLTHGPDSVQRSLRPMLVMQALALVLSFIFLIITRWILRSKEK